MELFIGGLAACGAGFFTNPLEVVKTRMQLQGELKARGEYVRVYPNSFQGFITIAKTDGLLALQKGLVPALWYQLTMNGFRLGVYRVIRNSGYTKSSDGEVSILKSMAAAAFSGGVGASFGSPFYMIKTHLQAQSSESIAVGYQHHHNGMVNAFRCIFKDHGIKGLWRGITAAIPRVCVGSAAQLTTFSKAEAEISKLEYFKNHHLLTSLCASMLGGVVVTAVMTPFDVVSTRMYNQGVDKFGKGLYYSNVLDCFIKVFKKEGFWGFYKGWGPSFIRLGPHTVLSLTFWSMLSRQYEKYKHESKNQQS